jgi:hypothetical protein
MSLSLRPWFAAPAVALTLLVPGVLPGQLSRPSGAGPITPQSPAPAPAAAHVPDVSTIADQQDLAVTVYNSDLALVRDVRQIDLAEGTSDLQFEDIAASVNPATVHFRSLTDPASLEVLEQNYEYDLLEPDKLLKKYVGRDVTLVRDRQDGGTTREEAVTARLLSFNTAPVWRINGEIVTGYHADRIRFPELPGNLHTRPTLIWTIANTGSRRQRVEASYLATHLSWSADYVLTVARDDRTADLGGWVTVVNGSGTAFPRASLQLVAGNLNRVRQAMGQMIDGIAAQSGERSFAPMTQEAFSEYHLYNVGRKTTIENSETKQISMLDASSLPVEKRYVVTGQSAYYRNSRNPGSPIKDPVQVFYQFTNRQQAGLGMPMPAGVVRVYQADARGGLQFVGEDRIDHTPKDETVHLNIGTAFDVIAERKQVDFEKMGTSTYEVEYEIVLRNHKTTPIDVEVNEPVGGTWRMLQSTHAWTKSDAYDARFSLPVAADGSATLRYRVRVTY